MHKNTKFYATLERSSFIPKMVHVLGLRTNDLRTLLLSVLIFALLSPRRLIFLVMPEFAISKFVSHYSCVKSPFSLSMYNVFQNKPSSHDIPGRKCCKWTLHTGVLKAMDDCEQHRKKRNARVNQKKGTTLDMTQEQKESIVEGSVK